MKFWNLLHTLPFFWRAALGLLLSFLGAEGVLALIYPLDSYEFGRASLWMGLSTGIALLAILGTYRWGWLDRSTRFQRTLRNLLILPAFLALGNVFIIAFFTFYNQQDLWLLSALLLLAGGILTVTGFLFTAGLAERIQAVQEAARRLASSEWEVRAPERGNDEISQLAAAFNQMAGRVQAAELQTQRILSLRSDIVAWAGGDLRTPLTVSQAILDDLASGEVKDPAAVERLVQTAQEELRGLAQIIADLEEISRLDSGHARLEMQPNSLGNIFAHLVKSFMDPARLSQVAISGQVEPGVDPVWIDTPRFNRALRNLVRNAIQRTPEGGEIKLRAWRAEGIVWIEIRDTSPGFAPDEIPYLFDRLSGSGRVQGIPSASGSELGLPVARSIVQAHQGSLEAENNPEGGARFLIKLTLTPPGIGGSRSIPSTLEEF